MLSVQCSYFHSSLSHLLSTMPDCLLQHRRYTLLFSTSATSSQLGFHFPSLTLWKSIPPTTNPSFHSMFLKSWIYLQCEPLTRPPSAPLSNPAMPLLYNHTLCLIVHSSCQSTHITLVQPWPYSRFASSCLCHPIALGKNRHPLGLTSDLYSRLFTYLAQLYCTVLGF